MDFIQKLKGLFGFVAFLSTFIYRGRISRQADNSNYHGCTKMATQKAIFGLEGLVYKKRGALADPVYIYKGASINSNDLWDDL